MFTKRNFVSFITIQFVGFISIQNSTSRTFNYTNIKRARPFSCMVLKFYSIVLQYIQQYD
jgi:hypothetical protein